MQTLKGLFTKTHLKTNMDDATKINSETKIAILYIALGRYDIFWQDFFNSSEKYFLPNVKKHYFVFTDNPYIKYSNQKNVSIIKQKKLGWPYDTLMRFDIFLTQKQKLKKYDYIFFFNASMKFVDYVGTEILPTIKNNGLAMGLHSGFYNKPRKKYDYDRNPQSTAFIPYNKGKYYVQGCLNGGTTKEYLKLCEICSKNIKTDLKNNVIALWHDESHINKYIIDKKPLIIPCNYLWTEQNTKSKFTKHKKIVLIYKDNPKYGGLDWLRGITNKKISC